MTMTIVEFLEARLAEDEAIARACADADHEGPELRVRIVRGEGMYVFGPHEVAPSGRFGYEEDARTRHFERHDPARALREIAAKRALIDKFKDADLGAPYTESPKVDHWDDWQVACYEVLSNIARIYCRHPDYRPEWALNP